MVTTTELAQLLAEAFAELVPAAAPPNPEYELPADEVAVLGRMGLVLRPRRRGVEDPVARTAADYAALVGSGLTVPQAANRLGVDGSRVRQRLAERTLYGIRLPSGWRLPLFQFAERGLVPGIGRVFPRLDPALHPVEVWRWFTQPDADLAIDEDEVPVSPLDWLRMGRSADRVAEMAAEL